MVDTVLDARTSKRLLLEMGEKEVRRQLAKPNERFN